MNTEKRIEGIRQQLKDRDLAGLIVTRYPCIGYVTGVYQRWGTSMFIPRQGQPKVFTVEKERVQDEAWEPKSLEVIGPSGYVSAVYYSRIQSLATEIRKSGLEKQRLGYEKAHISAAELEIMRANLPHAELVDASDLIPSLMVVKDHNELKVLRKLAGIADAGLNEGLKSIRVGSTELEVSGSIDLAMKRLGCEKTWFPTHVASGYRSDFNMAYPTDKVIQFGDKIAIDVGPMLQLYCGQLNVHVTIGKALPAYKKLFESAMNILNTVFNSLQPGKEASEVFYIAEQRGKDLGYREVLPHFGRGIGIIDNEEVLTFSPTCHTKLAPGMVLAIITYIREEQTVISNERMVEITEGGGRWLCSYPQELIEIEA